MRTRGRTRSNSASRQRRRITAAHGLCALDRHDRACHARLTATGLDTAAAVVADRRPAVAAGEIAGRRPAADTADSPAVAARTAAGRCPAASACPPVAACPDTSPPDTAAPFRDTGP